MRVGTQATDRHPPLLARHQFRQRYMREVEFSSEPRDPALWALCDATEQYCLGQLHALIMIFGPYRARG